MKKSLLASVLLASLSTTAFASDNPESLKWDYLEAGYASNDAGDGLEPSGWAGTVATSLGESAYMYIDAVHASDEFMNVDVDFAQLSGVIGYKYRAGENTDVFGGVGYGGVGGHHCLIHVLSGDVCEVMCGEEVF